MDAGGQEVLERVKGMDSRHFLHVSSLTTLNGSPEVLRDIMLFCTLVAAGYE